MTSSPVLHTWSGTITGLHDGDTVWVDYADLGYAFRWYPPTGGTHWLVRLAGIAARELTDPGGPEARDNLAAMLPVGTAVLLRNPAPDHYGNRIDAWLYLADSTTNAGSINDQLVADGWAVPWNGEGQQPKPAWPRVPAQGIGYTLAARTWKVGA